MKSALFENVFNREQVFCANTSDIEVIDGVAYLKVRRFGTERVSLMRKDALKKVNKEQRRLS